MIAGPARRRLLGGGRFWVLTGSAVVTGAFLFAFALVAAHGSLVGGDHGSGCSGHDPSVVGARFEEEVGGSVTPSSWPLGTDCTLTGPTGQQVTFLEDDWTLTVIAGTGVGLCLSPALLLPFVCAPRRRAARSRASWARNIR
ncbi:hypothetical protein DEI95_10215 [Curtobacterium sp. MCBD17_008]|nr:hypothetical protein DEI95_10215 [Curtobacterium sp. MCBD17_008]